MKDKAKRIDSTDSKSEMKKARMICLMRYLQIDFGNCIFIFGLLSLSELVYGLHHILIPLLLRMLQVYDFVLSKEL